MICAPDGGAVQSRTLQAPGRETVASGRGAEAIQSGYSQDISLHFFPEGTASTAVLRIPTFGIPNLEDYLEDLESIFMYLQKNTAPLIIDLRGNEGGRPIFAVILFSYLTEDGFTWFDDTPGIVEELAPLYQPMEPAGTPFTGKLYLLTDGACLSNIGHLLAHLQSRGIGVKIGEIPASFASCIDNSTRVVLPYSGIQGNIARNTFTIALPKRVEMGGPVLAREVKVTIEELLRGEDAMLEACFKLIEEQE